MEATKTKSRVSDTNAEEWVGVRADMCAAVLGYSAKFVDTSDKCADEAEIDEGDEEGVGAGAVVGEECCDGPHGAEDGDDEQDEDVVGSEEVILVVNVYKVC
jgi:hypothetical protein